MVSTEERARLQEARELIMEKQFAEARAILRGLTHTATARQWLDKLDEIAPEADDDVPPIQPVSGIPDWARVAPASNTKQMVNIVLDLDVEIVRMVVAGIAALTSVLMIVGFALFSWMDLGDLSLMGLSLDSLGGKVDEGPLKITALELWSGRNSGENFSLDLTIEDGQARGFSDVRMVDRALILLPFLALVLLWLAWMYAFPTRDGLSSIATVALMALVALVLLLFPLVWQNMSTSAMEDDLKGTMSFDIDGADEFDFGIFDMGMFTGFYTETYSTGEQQLLGALALLASLAGLGIEMLSGRSTAPALAPAQGMTAGD